MAKHQTGLTKTASVITVAAVALAGTAAFLYFTQKHSPAYFIDPSNREMVAQGQVIYASHCAACHGAKLEGQANWRTRLDNGRLPAPPHDETGHTWHHPDDQLFDIVKHGLVPGRTAPPGYESDMPAYSAIPSDERIAVVLAYIKSQWPEEAREAQKKVTLERQS